MIWYGLDNGQLRVLRKMLREPMEFDPVDFIRRTFVKPGSEPSAEVLELAVAYNQLRAKLLGSVGTIHRLLTYSAKLNFQNTTNDSSPLIYELNTKQKNEQIDAALKLKLCDGTNAQLDRILDSFNVKECYGTGHSKELHEVVKLYFFSEVLFLLLTKTAVASRQNDIVHVVPSSSEVVKQLHRKWFANKWEQNSCIANIAYIDLIPKGADSYREFPEAIEMLGKNLVDKVFFLPEDSLPKKLERSLSVQWIKKLCKLAALCMWCQTKNSMECAPFHLVHQIGFTADDVEKIKYYTSVQSEPDRVFKIKERGISVGNPSITVQLRQAINFIANEISDLTLNNVVGNFFEKTCVSGYFDRDEIRESYLVFSGFKPEDVRDEILRPDVDLIIKDIRRNKYYFTQVKYVRIGGKAFISGDIDHLVSGKLHGGMRQLLDAKAALLAGKLEKICKGKGLHDCTPENSHFLLIHNIFNFDFVLWPEGVVSYEWNSFRNILNSGKVQYGMSNGPMKVWQHNKVLPIEDPDALIDHYMKNSPSSVESSIGTIFDADNLVVKVELEGTQVQVRGLGF